MTSPSLLSEEARRAIEDGENLVYISAVVAWEIAIKRFIGKLEAGDVEEAISDNHFLPFSASVSHALAVERLPAHHKYPFDRLLIAQAMIEGLTLVSRDPVIKSYPV